MRTFSFSVALLLLATSCRMNVDCVTSNSDPVRKDLPVASFTGVMSDGAIDVDIVKGDAQRVEVEAPAELIALVKTDVTGGVWTITTDKCYSTNKPFRVHITTTLLNSIGIDGSGNVHSEDVFGADKSSFSIQGSGDIIVAGVNGKSVEARIEGSGNITLNGTCTDLVANISGSGDLRAMDLSANSAKVDIQGSGDAALTAITELDARVEGSGNVRYRGKPKVTSKVEGSGAVVPAE